MFDKIAIKSLYVKIKSKKFVFTYYIIATLAITTLSFLISGNLLPVLGDPGAPLPPGDTPLP